MTAIHTSRSHRFPSDVSHLASVRDFAVDAAAELGATVDREVLLVVVGELAANAAVHQAGEAEIRLSALSSGGIRIEVHDGDATLPQAVHDHALTGEGHRGLILVDALATRWGTERTSGGKVVWAELASADVHPLSEQR